MKSGPIAAVLTPRLEPETTVLSLTLSPFHLWRQPWAM